jgi:hypothetical protein
MAADTSIYNALLQRPKSAFEWQADYAAQDDAAQARQLNALNMREAQARAGDASMARQDQWTVRNALSGMLPDAPLQDRVKTLRGTGTPLGYTQAQELEKADQEAAKVRAQALQAQNAAQHSQAQTQALQLKAESEKHDKAIGEILSFQSPADAMESLRRHAAEGSIGQAEVQAMSRQLMGLSTPEQWQQWQDQTLYKLQDAKGKADLQMKRLEWQAKQRESASTLANRELVIGPDGQPRVNQPYVDAKARVAQAGAAVSYGSPVPFMLPDGSQGLAQTNNRGTSASVVKVDGVPVKAPPKEGKAPPVEFTKSVAGLKELENGLASYEQALKDYGGGSPLAMGDRRAGLQGAYTSLQMGLKNAFELGALAGPDLSLLEGMLASPTSFQAGALGDKGLAEQITQARQYLRNRGKAVYEAHKMPVPPEYAGAGGSAKTNKAGGAAVPDDIKALLDKHGGK